MELRQLRYFLEILHHANFGRAADALHITQPALSKSMRLLEADLGLTLLERGVNGVAPTPYGRILASYAGMATRELGRAVDEIRALAGHGGGTVRVGGSATFLRYVVPATIHPLLDTEPPLRLVIFEALRDEVVAALRRGDIDVAVVTRLNASTATDLVQETLVRDRICVVAAASHPLASKAAVTLEDLSSCGWFLPNAREPERKLLAQWMRKAGLPPPRVVVEGSSSVLMTQLLKGRSELSYLPRKLLRDDPSFSGLVALPCDLPWREIQVCVVYRRTGVVLPSTRAFIAAARRIVRDSALAFKAPS
jgi:DNA-binding transcriptional LysR family regulator